MSDKANNDLRSTEMRLPRQYINPTHGQGRNRLSDRDASAQRDRSKSFHGCLTLLGTIG